MLELDSRFNVEREDLCSVSDTMSLNILSAVSITVNCLSRQDAVP